MKRYAIRTFYDGSNYHGYQRQPDLPTIEGTLIDALTEIEYIESPDKNKFRSASRTDRYVNAIGNVFAFNTESRVILDQLNAALPVDKSIMCWSYAEVTEDFMPKYSKSKKYWYVLPLNYVKDTTKLTVEEIYAICMRFKGEKDFRLFCKMDERNTIREIKHFNIIDKEELIIFEIEANSFLWEQIRRIIAYILNYNYLPERLQKTEDLLKSNTQIEDLNIEPANPKQLILMEHFYDNIEWQLNEKAIKHIVERSNNLILKLKQEEAVILSICDFFNSEGRL